MEIVATHASVIVREVLTRDNYVRWSILMRHYLMGQDLWHIVESSQLPAERNMRDQWIKKNASVLHVIKVSCGEDIFDQIKAMDSAKDVWDALANMHKPPAVSEEIAEHPLERPTDTFTAQTFGNLGRSKNETLTNAISNGDLRKVQEIFADNQNAKCARLFENKYTALHFSVYNRKEGIVDYVISKLSKEELEIKDNFGSTALSIAARFGVGKSIAQKLVGKNSNLLTIPDNDEKIPVQLAWSTIHEDMARYLYVATPLKSLLKSLNGDCGFYILQECIIRKMFDIAFDLLHRFPELASPSCPPDFTLLILTLAKTPPPFFGGSNLLFWERWIYDCIRVKACSIKKDEHRPCVEKIKAFYQSCKRKIRDLSRLCGRLSWPIAGAASGDFDTTNFSAVAEDMSADVGDVGNVVVVDEDVVVVDEDVVAGATAVWDVGKVALAATAVWDEEVGDVVLSLEDVSTVVVTEEDVSTTAVTVENVSAGGPPPSGVRDAVMDRLIEALKVFVVLFVWPVVVPLGIFLGIILVMPAVIMLLMPVILGILILEALRILVSMLSRFFETPLYKIKLMDEYAREVIHLICHKSFSKVDEIQFVQSRAVEATFQAIKNGIQDIVKEIIKANENILWRSSDLEDSNSRSKIQNIFACAVEHRQEEVAHVLYKSAEEKNKLFAINEDRNNTLHLAAKLAPHYQSGYIYAAALQLQSELRWFKGVEEIIPRSYHEHKNNNRETPLEVFVREHKDLLKEAKEWVKKTAESSTVVSALIITVMFAAAFTVPGGADQSTGFPIFLHKTPIPFMVFMVSNAISLFAASSSVIMFLGILTSRFAYEDFLKSLPIRLIMGLSSLFVSIATMTMAFCAALFIMLEGRLWVVIPITLLAAIPVIFFVLLQFPLLVEIYISTSRPNIFDREVSFGMRIMKKMFVGLWAFVQR